MKLRLLTLGFAVAAFAAGCSDDDSNTGPATEAGVRVVHASPDAPSVDVLVDDAQVLSSVPYLGSSSYLEVPAGTPAYVMVTDLPKEARGVDAEPDAPGEGSTLADEELAELLTSGSPEQIRAALDDSRTAPRYLQTLVKRGFRFVAPVEFEEVPAAPRGAQDRVHGHVAVTLLGYARPRVDTNRRDCARGRVVRE